MRPIEVAVAASWEENISQHNQQKVVQHAEQSILLQLPVFSMGDLHTTHQQNNTAVS
jgi:hypothetical protein